MSRMLYQYNIYCMPIHIVTMLAMHTTLVDLERLKHVVLIALVEVGVGFGLLIDHPPTHCVE